MTKLAENEDCGPKKMTLWDARAELERQGFTVYDEDDHHSPSIVGVKTSCRWEMSAKLDVVAFVHNVPSGPLTLPRIEQDLHDLSTRRIYEFAPTCGFPPHGVGHGRIVILIYLVDGSIDPDAMVKILAPPKMEWCACTFLAAQDGDGRSFYMESTTPLWGRAMYPELRYWAGRLTGRPLPESPPGIINRSLVFFNLVFIAFILVHLWLNPFPVVIAFLTFMVPSLVASLIQYCRRDASICRQSRQPHALLLPQRGDSE